MRRWLVVPILLATLAGWAVPAQACSCAVLEPAAMLEFAPTAFVGTLVGRQPAGQGEFGMQDLLTFEVETVLAGEVPAEVGILSANNGAACGIEAALGSRLAVFATDEGGQLSSGLCMVTDADTALKALGPGSAPIAGGTAATPDQAFEWGALGLALGGLALVAVVWAFSRR